MRIVLDEWEDGVSMEGTKISNLRYADDTQFGSKQQRRTIDPT